MGTPHANRARRAEEHTRETRKERVDRELLELLNELRVALPGVQFLFAFLLIVPFQMGRATEFQRDVYFVTLLAVCVATGLLIAPAAQHRVLFRQRDKEALLHRSSRMAYAGLIVLALAISTAVLMVTDILFSLTQAWLTAAAVAAVLAWWWAAVPYWKRSRNAQDDLPDDGEA